MWERSLIPLAVAGALIAGVVMRPPHAAAQETEPAPVAGGPAAMGSLEAVAETAAPPAAERELVNADQEDDGGLERLARRLATGVGTQDEPATAAASADGHPEPALTPPPHGSASQTGGAQLLSDVDPRERLPLGPRRPSAADADAADADEGGSSGWFLTTFLSLGMVLGLIFLLRAGLTKLTGRPAAAGPSPAVEVLSRVAVAPKNHLLLVRLGQRILVLGDSSAGLTTLANLDDPEEVAALLQSVTASKPDSITRGFSQLMSRFNGQYDENAASEEGLDGGEHRLDRARNEVSGLMSRLRTLTGRGVGDG